MTDPAAQGGLARWLAYAHPAWMLAALTLAALALRSGLALRRARRLRVRRRPEDLRRHLAVAKPALVMVAAGFAGGPLSMAWLRGREPFATAHAWIGVAALLLFVAAGILGRRLERGRGRPRDAHALLATLALLAAAGAALTGFVLLP
ncbi:MAG: DUF4079 family protein [Deltaproteobacteria bacterium]|nr:DUF4079 family protein [Deltaproteobacteria bacterium]